jgi:hypothetical protein
VDLNHRPLGYEGNCKFNNFAAQMTPHEDAEILEIHTFVTLA